MTAIAKTLMNEIATKVQIGTAACAIAVAAAFARGGRECGARCTRTLAL